MNLLPSLCMMGQETRRKKNTPSNQVHGPYKIKYALNAIDSVSA